MTSATFAIARFLADVDRVRQGRQMAWSAVFRETACSYAFASERIRAHKKALSLDNLATLAVWASLDLNAYIVRQESERVA